MEVLLEDIFLEEDREEEPHPLRAARNHNNRHHHQARRLQMEDHQLEEAKQAHH